MSDQNTRIRFEATGNLTDFMKKLQQDGKTLYESFSKEAANQSKNQKEQFRLIRDQINALKEQLKVEKELTKERLNRAKRSYEGSTDPTTEAFFKKRVDQEQAKLNDIVEQQRASRDAAKKLSDEKQDSNKKPEKRESVINSVLMAGLIRDIFSLIKSTASAQTEFDLITPFATSAGAATGMLLGAPLGYLSPGLPGAVSTAGKELGGFAGAGYTRHLMAQEQSFAAANRVGALTGRGAQAPDLARFGQDKIASLQLEESIVRAIQRGTTAEQVKNVAAISRAFSIDQPIITGFLGAGRMGGKVNEGAITGLMAQGIDRSKLGEATQGLTQLLQMMGQTTLAPSTIEAIQKLAESNKIGGPFSVGDPRSISYLEKIQSNLVDPKTAFAQALSYKVLREQHPDVGVVELLKKRQEGGVLYERGILEEYSKMSGSSDFATLAYSGAFGTGNLAADELRLKNKNKIGAYDPLTDSHIQDKMGTSSNKVGMGMTDLYKEAERFTTTLQQGQAQVANAFIVSFTEGIDTLADRFTDRMSEAIDEWVKSRLSPSLNNVQQQQQRNSKGHTPAKRGSTFGVPGIFY